jgi:hypothetical protein
MQLLFVSDLLVNFVNHQSAARHTLLIIIIIMTAWWSVDFMNAGTAGGAVRWLT